MDKGFDVLRVSNLIIDTAKRNGAELTNLKLQKILFFLQGFYLYKYGAHLINGNFSKWQYGPVEKDAYDYFKSSGSSWLTDEAFDFSTDTFKIISIPPISADDIGDDKFASLEAELVQILKIPAWRLVELTHNDPSWSTYRDEIKQYSAPDYTDDQIEACYIHSSEYLHNKG